MIQWIKGAEICDSETLVEGYEIKGNSIESVLNAENILKIITSFITLYKNHNFFLFLEIPCSTDEEKHLNTNGGKLHKNIYYLDNIWAAEVMEFLKTFGEILVNDGLTAFGVGNHESEIGKYKYNTVSVFSDNIDNVKEIFVKHNIAERRKLLLPRDIFSKQNPGKSCLYKDCEGRTVYDVVETLKEAGLYKAEVRED